MENEELEFDLDTEQPNRQDKRIKDLSQKVEHTAKERDEFAKAKSEADDRAQKAERERDFYASFTDSIAQHPQASEYKDVIKEKVLSGYTVEDATYAVLAKEGKLGNPIVETRNPAGGSAPTNITEKSEKSVETMSQDERFETLKKLEAEGHIFFS